MIKQYENLCLNNKEIKISDVEILGFLEEDFKYMLIAHVPKINTKYYNVTYDIETGKTESYAFDKLSRFDQMSDKRRGEIYGN